MVKHYPLSPKQTEDWNYNQSLNSTFTPNILEIVLKLGHINEPALKLAFKALICNNDSLRTSFPLINQEPVQLVEDYSNKFDLICIKEKDIACCESVVKEYYTSMKNVLEAPLIRGFICRTDNAGDIFFILVHHIISDEWSINVIKNELKTLYLKTIQNLTPTPPKEKIQLTEYIRIKNFLYHEHHDGVLAYWKAELGDKTWQTDLDRIHKKIQEFSENITLDTSHLKWHNLGMNDLIAMPTGERYITFLNEEIYQALYVFKDEVKRGINIIFLTCLNLLGAILTDNKKILIQAHYMNRFDQVSATVIGNLIGKILLLNEIQENDTIVDLINQCNLNFFNATSKVIFNSSSLNYLDLTTRCFVFYNFISKEVSSSDNVMYTDAYFQQEIWVESPLICKIIEFENTISIAWSYHLNFFDRTLICQIAQLFEKVMYQVFIGSEQSLDEFRSTLGANGIYD